MRLACAQNAAQESVTFARKQLRWALRSSAKKKTDGYRTEKILDKYLKVEQKNSTAKITRVCEWNGKINIVVETISFVPMTSRQQYRWKVNGDKRDKRCELKIIIHSRVDTINVCLSFSPGQGRGEREDFTDSKNRQWFTPVVWYYDDVYEMR